MSQSTVYTIAKLQARMDSNELLTEREDALKCKPGNKPCGKICIPQEEKCALTGEKAAKKGGLTGAGKVAAFGAAAIAGGAIGYTALKAGQKASEARRQKQMEEEDKPKENSEPTKSANPVETPQARQSAPRSPKKQKGLKSSAPAAQSQPEKQEPKQIAAGTRPNVSSFLGKLNPFKEREKAPASTPSGGSAQTGKNRLIANKQNALDKESRRQKIYNNVDNSMGARSARKVAKGDSLFARLDAFCEERLDSPQCEAGNKPCGKICIPKEHNCGNKTAMGALGGARAGTLGLLGPFGAIANGAIGASKGGGKGAVKEIARGFAGPIGGAVYGGMRARGQGRGGSAAAAIGTNLAIGAAVYGGVKFAQRGRGKNAASKPANDKEPVVTPPPKAPAGYKSVEPDIMPNAPDVKMKSAKADSMFARLHAFAEGRE